ncbi:MULTISPECIES: YveK family protein [Microbacterium]|uniref:YveK family protein n=1 Tax=Microbacterium TaxID=33882 RepID=UPI000F602C47|nr:MULTISPECIES: hypothetical protein [Microbacterium]AZH79645.1 hypothetical protein CSX12_14945 [Microbacterium sp. Y-01]MDX2400707.1 hypothetical protein [Microbacterium algeriense]
MSPGEWFVAVRRTWLGMLTVFLLCVLGSGALLLVTPPAYEAESEIVFSADPGATNFVPRTVATNAAVRARSASVIATVAEEFDVNRSELADGVSATWIADTSMTAITVSHTDPRLAADLATAIAQTAADQAGSDVRARAYPAAVPESPVRPQVATTLAVGALLGIALAIVYAALRFTFSRRIRSLADAADLTGLPAYAWPNGEPTAEQTHELQLLTGVWAGEEGTIALLPVDATIDTATVARRIKAGAAGLTVVRLPLTRKGLPDAAALQRAGALVLLMKVGETSRRAADTLGHLRREGATNLRGVIVVGTGTRRRATSTMSEPANGERA